jgi:hypothetical protein
MWLNPKSNNYILRNLFKAVLTGGNVPAYVETARISTVYRERRKYKYCKGITAVSP